MEGHVRQVVGIVENPLDLLEDFALVAPGSLSAPASVSVLAPETPGGSVQGLGIDGAQLSMRQTAQDARATLPVLILATLGSIFVGLVAVAGFSVIAQRRLRGLGLLGALGATSRNLRLALLANGALVGVAGAVVGAVVGVLAWFLAVPGFERLLHHRIDRLNLSWWAILGAMALGIATSVLGSWWPARAAARTPVVSALATRPAPPRAPHLLAVPGALAMVGGLAVVAFAPADKPAFAVLGVAVTAVGMLLLAPVGTIAVAAAGSVAPVAIRLAVRDLARYRGRSGGAVAAVSLAVAISVAISVSAGAAQVAANASAGVGALPADQIVLWLGRGGALGPIPALSPGARNAAQGAVDAIASTLNAASTLALEAPVDPQGDGPTPTQVGDTTSAGTPTLGPVQLGIAHHLNEAR